VNAEVVCIDHLESGDPRFRVIELRVRRGFARLPHAEHALRERFVKRRFDFRIADALKAEVHVFRHHLAAFPAGKTRIVVK
jgi:hypothetical protein